MDVDEPARDDVLERALRVRRRLLEDADLSALRLFNGEADGVGGLVIEKFNDVLIVQLHAGRVRIGAREVRSRVEALHGRLGTRAVYRKTFARTRDESDPELDERHRDAEPWWGESVEPEQVILENGLRFIVRPYDGHAVGLFLEQRDNRRRVRELARGRRVLNAFSYTCGFSVAAAAGGAASVASVDLSKRFLEWGKRNFAANGIDPADHRFYRSDIFDFYQRARRQDLRFDLIVLDPPTFSRQRRPRRAFVLADRLEPLCDGAVGLLDPGGVVLLATNCRRVSLEDLEAALRTAGRGREVTIVDRPRLPIDFAGDPDYAKAVLARFD